MTIDEETWRIGELAAATGLTVRTLHHYDRIGLLRPSHRNRGRQRLYTEADAQILDQILALRGLGLQLNQIHECLRGEADPRPLVAEQLRGLRASLAAGEQVAQRLQSVLDDLDQKDQPTAQDLLELIQQSAKVQELVAGYLSPDQLAQMHRRHEELDGSVSRALRSELPRLYQRARAELDAGTDPEAKVVRDIAARIDEIGAALSGGDASLTAGVRRMWAERGDELYPGSGVPWTGLVDYLDRARRAGAISS